MRKHWTMGGHSRRLTSLGEGQESSQKRCGLSQGRPGKREKAVQAEVQTEQRPWGREEL